MASAKELSIQLNQIEVSLFEDPNPQTGFKRDITINNVDIDTNALKLQKIGLLRKSSDSVAIIDNLIWILGTHVLQLHEDYSELFNKHFQSLALISELQNDLAKQQTALSAEIKHALATEVSKQTMLKYYLVNLIRTYIQKNDTDINDPIYVVNGVDHAFKACLNYIDDYDFSEQETTALPDKLSLQSLHATKHLKRLNNQTANTITKLLQQQDTSTKPSKTKNSWYHDEPFTFLPISYKGFFNIGITAILTFVLFFLTSHLQTIKLFASAFSISNPFLAAGLLATFIILGISYITQLTPSNTLTFSEFLLKSFKSFLTMLVCLLVLIHFFYPYNFLNIALYNTFGGMISLALISSINILATVMVYILIDQLLTLYLEPDQNNQFPENQSGFNAAKFLLLRAPYRNYVWQFFQSEKNRRLFYVSLIIIASLIVISVYQQQFVLHIITTISTIFSISSIMAILAMVSVVIFATKLNELSDQKKPKKTISTTQRPKEHWLDTTFMLASFLAVMSYVVYIDFSLVENVFSILGNLFNLKIATVLLSSQFVMIVFLCTVPFLLPKNINLKEFFYKNPFLQAKHIFMELNEFYYLYGLKHPIVMMVFLGLFIVAFASFYNHFIPAFIAHFAYTLAISLINIHVGTGLLAFTASMMIGNMLIIGYDALTAGKRSYIAKLSRFWEMYPLDILAGVFLTLIVLNLFILIPYIQLHLGTVAMIGSFSFLFKIVVISYDFYRDNAQKSFISSALMMLLWPFIAIQKLMDNPSFETLYDMSRSLEKAFIFFLLTVLYDVPYKIFLRTSEVMGYGVFNILIAITKNYGIAQATSFLIDTKKSLFSYLDYFRCSSKTTIFTNRKHYRLWHLALVIGLIWLSFSLMTNGIGLLSLGGAITFSGQWFNPYNILPALMHNPFIHGIICIQFGWAIISILALALIGLTNITHKDVNFESLKHNLTSRFTELLLCTIIVSIACLLLCAINTSIIPTIQLAMLMIGLIIQSILIYRDSTHGLGNMMRHCFEANNRAFTANAMNTSIQTPSPTKKRKPDQLHNDKTLDVVGK